MRLDAVTAEIRPRSDWESVDLGLAMVRRDFWRCWAVWWLAMAVPTGLAGWWLWDAPAWWVMVFWWWKPMGSRLVLFELSRRLFGERPTWRQTLREIPRAWGRRFFYRMVWARLSPWLPVTLPVEELEGLRGKPYQQRCGQLTGRGQNAGIWVYLISDVAAVWFGFALLVLLASLLPMGQDSVWRDALDTWDPGDPASWPVLILRAVTLCVMVTVSLTDMFVTGAGFGIYLNNRTWIEGWDIELAFKRLARRLARVTVILAVVAVASWVPAAQAEAVRRDPAEVIREVKADEAFKVHTVIDKVPVKQEASWHWDWLPKLDLLLLGRVMTYAVLALLAGLVLWWLWKNRHLFMLERGAGRAQSVAARARVVMGMEVSPESLPPDVPAAVRALWRQGRHHEALGLLYRAAISRVIEVGRAEIQESDTEGECLRRVAAAGPAACPDYFRNLTGAWVRLAYAQVDPGDREVELLCERWPFGERSGL